MTARRCASHVARGNRIHMDVVGEHVVRRAQVLREREADLHGRVIRAVQTRPFRETEVPAGEGAPPVRELHGGVRRVRRRILCDLLQHRVGVVRDRGVDGLGRVRGYEQRGCAAQREEWEEG